MKTTTKVFITLFALIAWGLVLTCYFTPTKEQQEETEFQQRMDDASQLMHSEIKVKELGETYFYYRMIEPRYLNND